MEKDQKIEKRVIREANKEELKNTFLRCYYRELEKQIIKVTKSLTFKN